MTKRKAPAPALTTIQLIELAKQKLAERGPPEQRYMPMSDYRFAKTMGFRQQLVSSWRNGRTVIGRQFVTKFAEVTGLSEAYVFACLELEREPDAEIRGVLQALVQAVGREAAGVTLALGLAVGLAAPVPSQAATGPVAGPPLYILSNRRRRAAGRGWSRRRRSYSVIRALA